MRCSREENTATIAWPQAAVGIKSLPGVLFEMDGGGKLLDMGLGAADHPAEP